MGLLSVVYLSGIYSSAQIGALADKLGRRRVLWAVIVLLLAGITALIGVAVASGWHATVKAELDVG